jgi:hypothetical protein
MPIDNSYVPDVLDVTEPSDFVSAGYNAREIRAIKAHLIAQFLDIDEDTTALQQKMNALSQVYVSRTKTTAALTTVFTTTFDFNTDNHVIFVYQDGVFVPSNQYTKTEPNTITLNTGVPVDTVMTMVRADLDYSASIIRAVSVLQAHKNWEHYYIRTATPTTVLNLTFSYTVGASDIAVYINDVLIAPSAYTETSSTVITLDTATVANDKVVVMRKPAAQSQVTGLSTDVATLNALIPAVEQDNAALAALSRWYFGYVKTTGPATTVINFSFSYVPGSGNLSVYKNNVLLPASDYTETSATSITLDSAVPADTIIVGVLEPVSSATINYLFGATDSLEAWLAAGNTPEIQSVIPVQSFSATTFGCAARWRCVSKNETNQPTAIMSNGYFRYLTYQYKYDFGQGAVNICQLGARGILNYDPTNAGHLATAELYAEDNSAAIVQMLYIQAYLRNNAVFDRNTSGDWTANPGHYALLNTAWLMKTYLAAPYGSGHDQMPQQVTFGRCSAAHPTAAYHKVDGTTGTTKTGKLMVWNVYPTGVFSGGTDDLTALTGETKTRLRYKFGGRNFGVVGVSITDWQDGIIYTGSGFKLKNVSSRFGRQFVYNLGVGDEYNNKLYELSATNRNQAGTFYAVQIARTAGLANHIENVYIEDADVCDSLSQLGVNISQVTNPVVRGLADGQHRVNTSYNIDVANSVMNKGKLLVSQCSGTVHNNKFCVSQDMSTVGALTIQQSTDLIRANNLLTVHNNEFICYGNAFGGVQVTTQADIVLQNGYGKVKFSDNYRIFKYLNENSRIAKSLVRIGDTVNTLATISANYPHFLDDLEIGDAGTPIIDRVIDVYNNVVGVNNRSLTNVLGTPVVSSVNLSASSVVYTGTTQTVFYRAQVLIDPIRLLGYTSAETSIAVTNGGNCVSMDILDIATIKGTCTLRIYKGTGTNSYNQYCDIPIDSLLTLIDDGMSLNGYPWITRTAATFATLAPAGWLGTCSFKGDNIHINFKCGLLGLTVPYNAVTAYTFSGVVYNGGVIQNMIGVWTVGDKITGTGGVMITTGGAINNTTLVKCAPINAPTVGYDIFTTSLVASIDNIGWRAY